MLHVWEPPVGLLRSPTPSAALQAWSPGQIAELETVMRERAGRLLAEGVALAEEAGLRRPPGAWSASTGSPWRTILDVADELDASLIVARGARPLTVVRAVLGSVSNAVVHHAKRPVLRRSGRVS